MALSRIQTSAAVNAALNHPDKGKENGRCNRTACQRALAHEPEHQFMDGLHTGGPRLYYCAACAWLFDKADREFREPARIKREAKSPSPHQPGGVKR